MAQEKDKKPNFITIQQAAFESLLDRVNKTAVTQFKKEVKELQNRLEEQIKHVKKIDSFLWLVVAVLLIGFATLLAQVAGMVIEAWRFDANVYQNLKELQLQNQSIENLTIQQDFIKTKLDKGDFDEFKNCLKAGGWNNCFK
jgi:hypothetical protein